MMMMAPRHERAIFLFGLAVLDALAFGGWGAPGTRQSVPSSSFYHRRIRHDKTVVVFASPSEERPGNNINATDTIARVNKKIRVAKAQSEIDRILAGPDAPFDAESELKKVVSIVATEDASTTSSSSKEETADRIETLLYKAVEDQDFELAASKKQELDQLQMDDALAVLQVNSAYYRAFSQRDTERMKSLWVADDDTVCINPSAPPLLGSKQIADSWDIMFRSSSKFQSWVEPANIRIAMRGASTAVVTCDELVFARRFVRGQKRKSEKINSLMATNIFRKVGSKWLLAHHHASWHHESDASRYALNANTMNRLNQNTAAEPSQQKEIKMDGILGAKNFGPMLGDQLSNDGVKGNGKVRVVRGNLADFLGGNFKDMLGGNKNSEESMEAIIEFHENRNNDDGEDEDEEGDDEEEDEEEYEDEAHLYAQQGEVNNQAVSIVKQFSDIKSSAQDKMEQTRITQRRQSCIQLLRQLCGKGAISPKQKRLLLTDIISCSAREEASLVEAAFELLYDGSDDLDAAEEDFADQCRVLAGRVVEH